MYCPQCHQEINDHDQFCSYCGTKILKPIHNCPNCGHEIADYETVCSHCGYQLPVQRVEIPKQRYKITAIFLGVVFGGLGVHNFYLGYSSKGFIQLVLFLSGILTLGLTMFVAVIWGFVDVILLLAGSIDRDGDDHLLM